jgi:ACT domain-containing protein
MSEALSQDAVGKLADTSETPVSTSQPRSQPQLIKTANLQITVKSVTTGIDQVKAIAQQQQGDILNLSDEIPTDGNSYRTASVQLRVPQASLDAALQALKALGSLDRQSITAEDVSTQLIDSQARLKNLRKTEATLLEIMGRSGGVSDVLKVAQELSNVRNQVEQITAQLTALQNQVAYSSIRLNLVEVTASVRSQPAVGAQINNTWESATSSFGKFTVDLLQLGIWLMVYSPYWVLLGAIAALGYTRFKARPVQSNTEDLR